jgi:hypothetical protein
VRVRDKEGVRETETKRVRVRASDMREGVSERKSDRERER